MSMIGKGVKSLRKQDVQTQKSTGVGVKKTVFYHKATVGDTAINLMALSMPSEMATLGKSNPSAATLSALKLYFYQDNFSLFSSLRGWIAPQSYQITSSTNINFVGFTAADQEIFFGYVDNQVQTALKAVDARPLANTGTIAVGATDFVTDPFTVGMYPLAQQGAVLVFRNGILQMRNTNNATASPSADGNYQEVGIVGSAGSMIRFNVAAPGPNPDAIVVVGNGMLVERSDDSMMAYIESIAGQVNSMIPYVADTAGVPQSTFGSNPSSVDLRQYGNSVITLQQQVAKAPTYTTITSGTGTYVPPANAIYLKVKMVGGGGGGGGSNSSGVSSSGTAGSNTTFGPHTATGGQTNANTNGGAGGSGTIGAGATGMVIPGNGGGGSGQVAQGGGGYSQISGGVGGGSGLFGGGGYAGNAQGTAGIANSGGGGSGAYGAPTSSLPYGAGGGGGGGGLEIIIPAPFTSYTYSVGAGGSGGSGAYPGGNGGSGIIVIEEHYVG